MALMEQFGPAPINDMVATPQGESLLYGSPVLQAAILGFANASGDRAEQAFHVTDDMAFVGEGDNSQVWRTAGVAIKISTSTTGRDYFKYGTPIPPENLTSQARFMHALGEDLSARGVEDIGVPRQYLALRTEHGDQLSVQEYLDGWTSWFSWARQHALSDVETCDLRDHLKRRLVAGMAGSLLRIGVSDLGLRRGARLHGDNVLIPEAPDDPMEAPIRVIDQPSIGLCGKLAAGLVRSGFGHNSKHVPLAPLKWGIS